MYSVLSRDWAGFSLQFNTVPLPHYAYSVPNIGMLYATLNRRMSTDTNTNTNDFAKPVSHHISDVDHWGHADRNYYLFVALTFLFGFVGLDHMYLRSNETAFKKLLLNVFGLGIWYVWDVIQVLKDGAYVRKHGLNSPFDWIRGIGRGMFAEPQSQKEKSEWAAPKSYFMYTLLAICLGAFGADKFYMGANWQGMAKLFSVFNIFLFLFGILWVLWDAFHAYFDTKTLLKDGIAPPIPFSWFFGSIKTDAFKVQQVKEKDTGGFLASLLPSIGLRDAYRELVVPILQPTVGSAIQSVEKVMSVGTKAAALGASAFTAGPAFVGNLADQVTQQAQQVSLESVQKAAMDAAANRQPQQGGASPSSFNGPGPILAGALTAIVVAGGLKGFYDFLAKQQG